MSDPLSPVPKNPVPDIKEENCGFIYILERILYKLKEQGDKISKNIDTIEKSKEEIRKYRMLLTSARDSTQKKLLEDIIEKRQDIIKKTSNLNNNLLSISKQFKIERICVMRLVMIERYILSNIWQYPLKYKYPVLIENKYGIYPPCNMEFKVNCDPRGGDFFISLAVPTDSFHIEDNGAVHWFKFAELMIKCGKKYYSRHDFGLPERGSQYDGLITDVDQVFDIHSLAELQKILQKFDTWYGTTLD